MKRSYVVVGLVLVLALFAGPASAGDTGFVAPEEHGTFIPPEIAKHAMTYELPNGNGTIVYNSENPTDQVFFPKIRTRLVHMKCGGKLAGV